MKIKLKVSYIQKKLKVKEWLFFLSLNNFIDKALDTIEECINDPFCPAEGESLEILKTYKKRLMTRKNLVSIKKVTRIWRAIYIYK